MVNGAVDGVSDLSEPVLDDEASRRRLPFSVDAVTVLSLLVVALVLIPSRYVVGPLGSAGTPAILVAAVAFGWYCASIFTERSTPLRGRQPVRTSIFVYVCAILASFVAATTRPISPDELQAANTALLPVIGWCGIALLAADGIPNRERLDVLLRRFVMGATFVAIVGIVQFATAFDLSQYLAFPGLKVNGTFISLYNRDGFNRPTSTTIHPIEFSATLAMALPLALHNMLYGPAAKRWSNRFCVAALAVAIPLTVSRTAVLGMAVTFAVLMPTWPRAWRHAAYVALLMFTGVMGVAVPGLLGTFKRMFLGMNEDSSATARTDDYAAVAEYFSQHPLFGRGVGTFLPHVYRILDNQYLATLVETGAFGLSAVLLIFVCGWTVARRSRRKSADAPTRHLGQALAAGIAVFAVTCGTFDAFSFPVAVSSAFLLIGCAGALWRITDPYGGAYVAVSPRWLRLLVGRGSPQDLVVHSLEPARGDARTSRPG
ncbi:O-antigen polymerase [Microbispora tritici]|uniref:O-antigen polymerase n=2 Tax=Microbispora TaxID=2005 RepID=A0ABY3LXA7_9ACTN|nr:O-antigen polymerase [Microbispora fusca]TYB58497.1 O-antigen polymerase [Microbispora tritici]